jgi:hypothetical protein
VLQLLGLLVRTGITTMSAKTEKRRENASSLNVDSENQYIGGIELSQKCAEQQKGR